MHLPIIACTEPNQYTRKTISGEARQAKRSLDSTVSRLLALISRRIHATCLAHHQFIYATLVVQYMYLYNQYRIYTYTIGTIVS